MTQPMGRVIGIVIFLGRDTRMNHSSRAASLLVLALSLIVGCGGGDGDRLPGDDSTEGADAGLPLDDGEQQACQVVEALPPLLQPFASGEVETANGDDGTLGVTIPVASQEASQQLFQQMQAALDDDGWLLLESGFRDDYQRYALKGTSLLLFQTTFSLDYDEETGDLEGRYFVWIRHAVKALPFEDVVRLPDDAYDILVLVDGQITFNSDQATRETFRETYVDGGYTEVTPSNFHLHESGEEDPTAIASFHELDDGGWMIIYGVDCAR